MATYQINTICGTCDGTGLIAGIACHDCGGLGSHPKQLIEDLDDQVVDILDKLNDIVDKCNDILEQVSS